jgi:hypothetical protein
MREFWTHTGTDATRDGNPADRINDLGNGMYQRSDGTTYNRHGNMIVGSDGSTYFDHSSNRSSDGSTRSGSMTSGGVGAVFTGMSRQGENAPGDVFAMITRLAEDDERAKRERNRTTASNQPLPYVHHGSYQRVTPKAKPLSPEAAAAEAVTRQRRRRTTFHYELREAIKQTILKSPFWLAGLWFLTLQNNDPALEAFVRYGGGFVLIGTGLMIGGAWMDTIRAYQRINNG